jgi:hypothetical protein
LQDFNKANEILIANKKNESLEMIILHRNIGNVCAVLEKDASALHHYE